MRRVVQAALGLAATGLVTVGFRTLLSNANETTVGFAYLLMVLATASTFGLPEALIAAVAAMLQYNYFFLPPVGTLTIQDPRNWAALTTFLITAVVASHLSAAARRRAGEAERQQREAARMYTLSRAGLLAEPEQVRPALERALVETFELEDARIAGAGEEAPPGTWTLRCPLRMGQRETGTLYLRGGHLEAATAEALAGVVAIGMERARVGRESSRLRAVQESEALKTALLDSVTHDLRTPLTSIKAAVTTLQGGVNDAAAAGELLAVINEECDTLNRLLQNLVDMARIEAGALATVLRAQELRPIVEEAARLAHTPAGRLHWSTGDEPLLVRADAALLSRALAQLLANALAYSPPESPIEVRLEAAGGEVRGEIRDSGPGIAAESLERVFDKFYRDERARRARPEGLGVGLAIARGILTAHAGRLEAESKPGEGACFRFVLPAITAATPRGAA